MTEKDEAVFAEAFEELAAEGYFTRLESKFKHKPKTKTKNVSWSDRRRSHHEKKLLLTKYFGNRTIYKSRGNAEKVDQHGKVWYRAYINRRGYITIEVDKDGLERIAKRKGTFSVSLLSQERENIVKPREKHDDNLKSMMKEPIINWTF